MDTVCLSEIFNSSIPIYDNLEIPGCSSVTADHPSDTKCGGILIYNKSFLTIKLNDVNFELRTGRKVCQFLPLYR